QVKGVDAEPLVVTFRSLSYLPLTKLRLELPGNRKKTVYVRARRMFDSAGEPMGSVIIIDDVSDKELLLDSFSRYVSRDLLQRLLARNAPLGLEGERRVATVLFADIRGFTGLAEKLAPEQLHSILNEYFHVMIEAIAGYGGFIDKFVGDMVMALFVEGSPADCAVNALKAARRIKKTMGTIGTRIDVGIGINTGEVLLGNIGTEERMDFTAIGDAVNVANRLEALARSGVVLVGDPTRELVGDKFDFRDRGDQDIRGRASRFHAWELVLDDRPSSG
ncbi:MAG TPA: adenylate/guanylate cyclase domain-containing protein, partial [bacterium]|nr:adenylate/guanylate cyclase domain-containing protein [bacterium]